MPTTYEKADAEVMSEIKTVMKQYHPDLVTLEVKLSVLMASAARDEDGKRIAPAVKLHGVPRAATVQIIPYKQRAAGRQDAEIIIDADEWKERTEQERAALLDHELYHLEPQRDEEGVWKSDDCGRPKLKMRHHDFDVGWFHAIARRHGDASYEVQQAKAFADENGQCYFGWASPPAGGGIEQGPTPTVAMSKLNEIVVPADDLEETHAAMDEQAVTDEPSGACPNLTDDEPAAPTERLPISETAWIEVSTLGGKWAVSYTANIGRTGAPCPAPVAKYETRESAIASAVEELYVWLNQRQAKGFRGDQAAQAEAIQEGIDALLTPVA